MLDVAANEGWLVTTITICNLVQMIVQGRWLHDSSLLTLPHVERQDLYMFRFSYYLVLLHCCSNWRHCISSCFINV